MRRLPAIPFLLLAAAPLLRAGDPAPGAPTSAAFLVEVHQISPAGGLRDLNSRSGYGGMVGMEVDGEVFGGRFVLEAGSLPAQELDPESGKLVRPFTWGGGADGLARFGRPDLNVYLLAGLHFDHWGTSYTYSYSYDSSEPEPQPENSDATHLGLRVGAGLNAGPFFAEVRYRITGGDLSVPGDQRGSASSWSAVEAGAGLRIRF